MTSVSTEHPYGIPLLEHTYKGRRISFEKECMENVTIMRRVNDGEWELLIERVRSPYTDEEDFPKGTKFSYAIELQVDGKRKRYEMDAKL